LLQFVLLKLWTQSGSSGRLTLGDYEGIGTFSGALNKHAENVYQQHLSETQRPLAQSVFIRLVQPFQTTRFAKQTQGFEELYPAEAASEQKKQIQEVIGILAGHDARLLTIGRAMGQDETSRPIVDLAHEILISCWDRYERWLNEKREFLLWKERLRVSLTDWRDSGRAGGTYLSGILLNQARNWLRVHPAEHSPEERQFINTSRRRRALRVAALAGVLLAVVSAAAYWNNRIATREKLLNNARILIRQGNPLALVVALHAAETYDRTALLQQAYQAAANPLYLYLNGRPVADLQFSSSDDKIAIALGGDTGEVRLCDTRGNCETFKAPGERVTCVAFGGASGEALLAGSEDGTVTIWQGGSVTRYEAGGRVNALGWAPDSGAVAGVGGELVVFRPQRTTIADFTDAVRDLAVSPDGARIAVAGADEKLRIWRKTGVQEHDNGAPMRQVMFSSDGATLATVDMLGAAYVWDLNNMSRRAFRRTASVPVTGGSLSADGKVLATLNADHSISAWDVATGRETQYYADQNEEIERISLNSDGSRLAAGRDDGNVQLYELNFDRLRARTRDRLRTVYDADGCRLYLSVSDCERYAPQ
jgi:hypothetical protein